MDETESADLTGASVVVGITYEPTDGEPWHTQIQGIVRRADRSIIEIEKPDGSTFTFPPAPEAFGRADPGIYTLRATGEEVHDPDYTAQFTVKVPPGQESEP